MARGSVRLMADVFVYSGSEFSYHCRDAGGRHVVLKLGEQVSVFVDDVHALARLCAVVNTAHAALAREHLDQQMSPQVNAAQDIEDPDAAQMPV